MADDDQPDAKLLRRRARQRRYAARVRARRVVLAVEVDLDRIADMMVDRGRIREADACDVAAIARAVAVMLAENNW